MKYINNRLLQDRSKNRTKKILVLPIRKGCFFYDREVKFTSFPDQNWNQ